ncbi:DoxX family protein [Limnovirga soli]|uniref:DoxX family protein n=1 Tax=Limnovirga soli TaxID=2656915 RepID=A0A8J8FAC8_9BACT|nr:DoxX family protein [Limnovirga soli]NNV53907.1 DoxX family protein [Limnovirga soli]
MKQKTISRIAISLLAIVMFIFGLYHFMYPQNLIAYLPGFLPPGNIWVYIPGAAFILAAIAFITNKQVRLAGYLLALLLFIFVVTIHLPNYLNGSSDEYRQISLINLLKDLALAAFALHIAANADN